MIAGNSKIFGPIIIITSIISFIYIFNLVFLTFILRLINLEIQEERRDEVIALFKVTRYLLMK